MHANRQQEKWLNKHRKNTYLTVTKHVTSNLDHVDKCELIIVAIRN